MATDTFLAMTAAEIEGITTIPPRIGWMACQFSPWSQGLSNLPNRLPEGALLILNDFSPMDGHNPSVIGAQLRECIERFSCMGLLLDLQRPEAAETAALAEFLVEALPCPVAVSEPYARGLDCPVFLPPVAHHVSLTDHLVPWKGREIWLDLAADAEEIRLTPKGAVVEPLSTGTRFEGGHWEEKLHCHYRIELFENEARFTLWRSREDLEALLEEAKALGVTTAVGLWQELEGVGDARIPPVEGSLF